MSRILDREKESGTDPMKGARKLGNKLKCILGSCNCIRVLNSPELSWPSSRRSRRGMHWSGLWERSISELVHTWANTSVGSHWILGCSMIRAYFAFSYYYYLSIWTIDLLPRIGAYQLKQHSELKCTQRMPKGIQIYVKSNNKAWTYPRRRGIRSNFNY